MPRPLPDRLLPLVSAVRLVLRLLALVLAVRLPLPAATPGSAEVTRTFDVPAGEAVDGARRHDHLPACE